MQVEQSAVLEALKVVQDPDLHRDIVSLGFIKDLKVSGGHVAFTIELTTPACPVKDQMRDQARAAVLRVPGVSAVDVQMSARVREAVGGDGARQALAGVKNVIAVGAGKGGVGKTTVAVNLAISLAKCGGKVGIIDGDIYGPRWVDLDYLVVDLPPGTGDVALSLSQTVPVAGAIVVTTPQQVSLADSRRAVAMYKKLNIPPLGIIENMSHFVCTNCGHGADIFGSGGGERMAEELGVPFLGRIPIYQPIREGGDAGVPLAISEPASPAARAFMAAAERTAAEVSIKSYNRPTIPLTVVR
jgi:ATP-binding protein involved in chromosome partitioning